MVSQKVRPTALRRFFRTLTYEMYAFTPEKLSGLVGRNFCFALYSTGLFLPSPQLNGLTCTHVIA
jgi:hypothetical protein